MLNLLKVLRQDEHGVILSTEIVIIGSLLVIGLITGLTCLQKSVNGELHDLAGAIGALDQTYSFSAHRKSGVAGSCCAYTAGSSYYNCENKDQRYCDIIGCTDACELHAAPCGNCGTCSQCTGVSAGVAAGVSACGTCGGRAGGCSVCGSTGWAGSASGKNSRCIDTGVPRMKVTEWAGPRSSVTNPSGPHLPGEVIVVPSLPETTYPEGTSPQDSVIHEYPEHEHSEPVYQDQRHRIVPAPLQPAQEPTPEVSPMPIPETQPLPLPAST